MVVEILKVSTDVKGAKYVTQVGLRYMDGRKKETKIQIKKNEALIKSLNKEMI